MDAVMIVILCMTGCVLIWVLLCCIFLTWKAKQFAVDENFAASVVCEKCNTPYTVNAEDFMKSKFVKYKKVTRKMNEGNVNKNHIHYISYGKRFDCPCCGKKRFARVENINELNQAATPVTTGLAFKCLAYMLIGGFVIILVFQIPLAVAKRDKQKKIDEMKQQMYEDTLEKSGLDLGN